MTEIDLVVADSEVRGAVAAALAALNRTVRSSRYTLSDLPWKRSSSLRPVVREKIVPI